MTRHISMDITKAISWKSFITLSQESIKFSVDGSLLASGSDDQSVRLWSVDDSLVARYVFTTIWLSSVDYSLEA